MAVSRHSEIKNLMLLSPPEREGWIPDTVQDRQSILVQMEKILASPPFRHSKRYPVMLRYVVEQTVNGRFDDLKERTLGVEVFQRHATYDTNSDPIVRVTAGEVRKRIAQYYHESEHADELRIDLPPGSYVPVFHLGQGAPSSLLAKAGSDSVAYLPDTLPTAEPHVLSIAPKESSLPEFKPRHRWFVTWLLAFGIALSIIVFVSVYLLGHRGPTLSQAWSPILGPKLPVLISMGEPSLASDTGEAPTTNEPAISNSLTISQHTHQTDSLAFSDVQAFSRMAGYIDAEHGSYRLQVASSTSFADLRQGPAILIGGFDNPWTLRALRSLRFHFFRESGGPLRIQDNKDPGSKKWAVDFSQVYADLGEDYAIVARFTDTDTHQPVLIVAGIGENGTKAAGELVSNPEYFKAVLPSRGQHRNFEAVLRTKVINGVSGPPTVLAEEEW